ncbi:hypothetical protein KAU33_04120 [Candidatus Dependentiae bacterium]|nr:hypothetical protein [Candidatus Dependentiae bacterium]
MNKINTLFVRGEDFKATPEVMPGCEWVLEGEGVATEKLDGTNIMVVFHQDGSHTIHKRKNPNREEKKLDIQPINIPVDPENKADRYLIEAVENFVFNTPDHELYGVKYGEAIGPKINKNRYELEERVWVPFKPHFIAQLLCPRTFEELKEFLVPERESVMFPGHPIEGIVFHSWHSSAKIKVQDFHTVKKQYKKVSIL